MAQHKDFEILEEIEVHGKAIQVTCMQLVKELIENAKIERGVRQGRVSSLTIYLENQKTYEAFLSVNNIRFTDDIVLVTNSEEKLLYNGIIENNK